MSVISAGLLMYKTNNNNLEIFLVHPGGPLFQNKDAGYWGIPKGLQEDNEDLLQTALREFHEETGITQSGNFLPLGTVKQKNNKTVYAWAFETLDNNITEIHSNTFEMEWPPHSGRRQRFPEVDRGNFFSVNSALKKIVEAQRGFIYELKKVLNKPGKL